MNYLGSGNFFGTWVGTVDTTVKG